MEKEILLKKLLCTIDHLPPQWEADVLWLIKNLPVIEQILTAVPADCEALQSLSRSLVREQETRLALLSLYQKMLLESSIEHPERKSF